MEMKWLKNMNEMFENNAYTDDKRVTVDYCENAELIFIKAFDTTATVNVKGFNEYGAMMKVLNVVSVLCDVL